MNSQQQTKQRHIEAPYLNLDYSYQRLSDEELQAYAKKKLPKNYEELKQQLIKGEYQNKTESRTVSHVLCRSRHNVVRAANGKNRFNEIVRTLRSGNWKGATGKAIKDVVNIGVGGSDLGPMMGSFALKEFADDSSLHTLNTHFVSSMDGGQLYAVLPIVDPETTLFIIASKSFTTSDTLANVDTVKAWVQDSTNITEQDWIKHHVIGVSSNLEKMNEFGIPAKNQLSFADSVGGRFSLWSAIGLPIALTVGTHQFAKMLEGAKAMDDHFAQSNDPTTNIPLNLALTGIHAREEEGINNVAVLPYDGRLRYLPSYLQQLDMESNGKQADHANQAINTPTGPIIWGGFGPNGQHAFFQHLHQGHDKFTADFIAVLHREAPGFQKQTQRQLREQQRLAVANCLAHRQLMWQGSQPESDSPRDVYPGNHTSNLLYVDELTPQSFGALIAAYEHKVFIQGIIWGINSFDQPGVEKGKKVAVDILKTIDAQADAKANRTYDKAQAEKQFDASTDAIIKRM
ncbi:glucose-6-phosphate isomerase [Pseudidiomarina taiwanensis]|uniref:Glucose-6-phosphate isomerase n=1 Tax=Pseudidiomarina taiwanensis TaxID=337250 RepID=A0A432ZKB9_9GAMM|nr:glucose-6-phosphate isomerase [Pseudidiomarina taiwanensis]RUO78421.1 glucose-6-phosphate isomerase [Pseudidiomarina taiwanensis]